MGKLVENKRKISGKLRRKRENKEIRGKRGKTSETGRKFGEEQGK